MRNTVSEKPVDCIGGIPRDAVRGRFTAVSSFPNCRTPSVTYELEACTPPIAAENR
jgi:hypothetical protein